MSTRWINEGNIGLAPELKEFANGNDAPRKLLKLNVRFDNPVPIKDGGYEDRGGFWATVELWHENADVWCNLYQKGMRVLVDGRLVQQEWEDEAGNKRTTFKVEARHVGILPYRVTSVTVEQRTDETKAPASEEPAPPKETKGAKKDK